MTYFFELFYVLFSGGKLEQVLRERIHLLTKLVYVNLFIFICRPSCCAFHHNITAALLLTAWQSIFSSIVYHTLLLFRWKDFPFFVPIKLINKPKEKIILM